MRRTVLLLTVMTVALVTVASPAWAETFTVNSTGDDGDNNPGNGTCATAPFPVGTEPECTLRAAIEEANARANSGGPDEIHFNIPASGVQTISTNPDPPSITITEPVVIDGYTQPGASENTLAVGNNAVVLIRLDGGFANRAGLRIVATGSGSVVRGLSITRFTTALEISGADDNTIEGNFIGTDPGGKEALGSNNSLILGSGESNSQSENNTVGGTSPGARNVISGNRDGVVIVGTGTTANKVMGNYIGTTKSGTGKLGNQNSGVFIGAPGGNTVGDDDPSDGLTNAANIIAFNGGDGVRITNDTATGNSILSNSIFSNAALGIDLGSTSGVTPNDGPVDADTGPNNLQNYPLITSAKTRDKTTIKGTLESTPTPGAIPPPSGIFTIQFFSNPKGTKDEGKKFIGETTVIATEENDGIMPFTFKPEKKVKAGLFVTATATRADTGDTSEFSAPKKVRG